MPIFDFCVCSASLASWRSSARHSSYATAGRGRTTMTGDGRRGGGGENPRSAAPISFRGWAACTVAGRDGIEARSACGEGEAAPPRAVDRPCPAEGGCVGVDAPPRADDRPGVVTGAAAAPLERPGEAGRGPPALAGDGEAAPVGEVGGSTTRMPSLPRSNLHPRLRHRRTPLPHPPGPQSRAQHNPQHNQQEPQKLTRRAPRAEDDAL